MAVSVCVRNFIIAAATYRQTAGAPQAKDEALLHKRPVAGELLGNTVRGRLKALKSQAFFLETESARDLMRVQTRDPLRTASSAFDQHHLGTWFNNITSSGTNF